MGKEGTWETLKKHPMTLMRMVIEGQADIIGKDEKGRYIYRLKEGELEAINGRKN